MSLPPRLREIAYRPIALQTIETSLYITLASLAILVVLPFLLAMQAR